jgi:hypothetical protein
MARPGFYNDNAHRSYPFLDADLGMPLPESAVVDFGCLMGLSVGYDDEAHKVYLHRVYRDTGVFRFEFRCTAPAMAGQSLTFLVPDTSSEYASFTATVDVAPGSSGSSLSSECGDDPDWEGFLVIGDLFDLKNAIAVSESLDDVGGATTVEPALVQNLARTFVRAVHLANADRVRTQPPPGCPDSDVPTTDPDHSYVIARCLTGDLKFVEGYNSSIRQSDSDNAIVIGASVGAGAGQPCDEVPLYPGEMSPDGGQLLTGGPTCGEILKSINGVGGKVIRLNQGTGVRITPGETEGELIVAVDLHDLAVCRTSSITV